MRKFAFVVFDMENKIKERFNVDLISNISGLGFKMEMSTLAGDVTDTLTKIMQIKQPIKLTVNFWQNAYEKYNVFTQWLQKQSKIDTHLALEYDDDVQKRYIEGKVTELTKGEMDEYKLLSCAVTFTPLTPSFVNVENVIIIKVPDKGKSYPFQYPYSYGKNMVENNEISNPYIAPVPVTVKIAGSIEQPTVQLLNESGENYCRVRFSNITLTDGQYILINSASRKIYYFDGVEIQDYTAETDPNYDTFLMAESGKSTVSVNLNATDTGQLTGSWRQYGL